MSTETTSKGKLGDLERLLASLTANAAELPHLEASRNQLGTLLGQAREAADLQALHTAGKQEASRNLQIALTEGMRLANVLRLATASARRSWPTSASSRSGADRSAAGPATLSRPRKSRRRRLRRKRPAPPSPADPASALLNLGGRTPRPLFLSPSVGAAPCGRPYAATSRDISRYLPLSAKVRGYAPTSRDTAQDPPLSAKIWR
jgi:hypothetical protein